MYFVDVFVEGASPVTRSLYTYRVDNVIEDLSVGDLVRIPFARKKDVKGVVITSPYVKNASDFNFEVKFVSEILRPKLLDLKTIELAKFISADCFCSFEEALDLFIPDYDFSKTDSEPYIRLKKYSVFPKNHKQKQKVLDYLKEADFPIKKSSLIKTLSINSLALKALIKDSFIEEVLSKEEISSFLHSNKEYNSSGCVVKESSLKCSLNVEQDLAFNSIINHKQDYLLHGVTGSGKTEVYFALMEHVLREGKSVLYLVPEISLTPQLLKRVKDRFFDEKIAVLHSRVSKSEKKKYLADILSGECKIVVGARSGIFAPLSNIGLIIVDECHEHSFASQKRPRYDAIRVVRKMSQLYGAYLVFGSATPSVEMYREYEENHRLISLKHRYNSYEIPKPIIIDMKIEKKTSMLSSLLIDSIKDRLEKKEQVILFINVKGYAPTLLCKSCGEKVSCPHCDVSLTFHKHSNSRKCGYCGYEEEGNLPCSHCGSQKLAMLGFGTEKVETEVKKLFPDAITARLDKDTIKKKGSLEQIIDDYEKGKIDILIGTQIIAKGLDFKNLTLVGIVLADIQLSRPSYLASENAFQLFTQVSGRAGRAGKNSDVILQTFTPNHYAITSNDYEEFYAEEINFRKSLEYPPFKEIIALTFESTVKEMAAQSAIRSYDYLKRKIEKENLHNIVNLFNPSTSRIGKLDKKYRFQIYIKYSKENEDFVKNSIISLEKKIRRVYQKEINIIVDIGAKENGT